MPSLVRFLSVVAVVAVGRGAHHAAVVDDAAQLAVSEVIGLVQRRALAQDAVQGVRGVTH